MKYYSEITRQNYDTVEALEEAEKNIKAQFEQKAVDSKATANVVNTERKEAAKAVEDAFAKVSALKKEHETTREEIEKKFDELNEKFDAMELDLEKQRKEESKVLNADLIKLDKEEKEALENAYKELREFCKKYGAYHYSVDTAGADLFPMLMGFGHLEKAQNAFENIFGSMFNLF